MIKKSVRCLQITKVNSCDSRNTRYDLSNVVKPMKHLLLLTAITWCMKTADDYGSDREDVSAEPEAANFETSIVAMIRTNLSRIGQSE